MSTALMGPGGGSGSAISAKTINAMKQSPIVPCIFYDGAIERNIGGGHSGTRSTVAIQFDFTPLQRVKFYGRYFVDNGDYHEQTQPWWIGDDQLSSDGSLASGSTKLYNLKYASTSHSDSYVSVDVSSITGKHYLCLQLPWDYGAVYIDYLKLIYNDA